MGWRINNVVNDVEVSVDLVKDLAAHEEGNSQWDVDADADENELLDYVIGFKDDHDGKFKLFFNDDHMEHMDFLHNEWIQDVLKKHKAKGDICFSSDDGDNAGSSWGYRFDGNGGMVTLTGKRMWVEDPPPTPKPKKAKKTKR